MSIPICTHCWGVPEKPVLMCVSGKGAGDLSLTSTAVRQAPSWAHLPGREGVTLSLSRSKVRALVQGHLARDSLRFNRGSKPSRGCCAMGGPALHLNPPWGM